MLAQVRGLLDGMQRGRNANGTRSQNNFVDWRNESSIGAQLTPALRQGGPRACNMKQRRNPALA